MKHKTIHELNLERKTNFTHKDFPIGTPVEIMCVMCDHYPFYNEQGKVIANNGGYLGITVEFFRPRHFIDGHTETAFNFNPTDLAPLTIKEV